MGRGSPAGTRNASPSAVSLGQLPAAEGRLCTGRGVERRPQLRQAFHRTSSSILDKCSGERPVFAGGRGVRVRVFRPRLLCIYTRALHVLFTFCSLSSCSSAASGCRAVVVPARPYDS